MEKIYDLLAKKEQINRKIKTEKKKEHYKFCKFHKKELRVLDIMVCVFILFNFGAVLVTNMTAVKELTEEGKELLIMEVNPIHAEVNEYELHPESNQFIWVFVKQAILWMLIIMVYVSFRRNMSTEHSLYFMIVCVSYLLIITGYNFFNDLGFLVGRSLYGA